MKNLSLSGFMLGVCTAGVAQTSTCGPGFYDPAGGSACVPAPVGSYVNVPGATSATPAAPGSFVAVTGATAANLAPIGFYVAGSGASSAQAVSSGFYTPGFGASAPVGAGLLATGANHAVGATRQLLGARPAPMDDSGLAAQLLGASSSIEQDGITGAERPSSRSAGVLLQGQLQTAAAGAGSAFAGWVEQRQETLAAGTGRSTAWLAGWSQRLFGASASAFAGQSRGRGVREVREVAPSEQQSWSSTTRIVGVQAAAAMRLTDWRAEWRIAGGVTQFSQQAFTEAGSAGSTAGLRVDRWRQLSVPVQLTLWHDLGAAGFEWGARADLNGKKALQASLTNGQTFAFEIPVGQAATQALLARLTLNGWDLGSGLRLRGALGVEAGSKTREVGGQIGIEKRW